MSAPLDGGSPARARRAANEPLQVTTLVDMLRAQAERSDPDVGYVFLGDGENETERVPYAELDRRARVVAARLSEHGEAGDRVVLLFPFGVDFIAAFFGCLYARRIAVPTYPRFGTALPQLVVIVESSGAKVVLSAEEERRQATRSKSPVLDALTWLCFDPRSGEAPEPDARARPDDVAFLQYTSGSTGFPRGVVLGHDNVMANLRMLQRAYHMGPDRTGVTWLPMYHDMGLIGTLLNCAFSGARCILVPTLRVMHRPLRWLRAVSRYEATHAAAPDFAYDMAVRRSTPEEREGLNLSSLLSASSGAEPVRASTTERFIETFERYGFRRSAFHASYGLAETCVFCTTSWEGPLFERFGGEEEPPGGQPGEGSAQRLIASNGPAEAGGAAIAALEGGGRCPEGVVGEIVVRGPHVGRGYWKQPELSEAVFRASVGGEGPFLRTGDLGFVKGGRLFVTGRIKDLIIVRGQNHHPTDIEATVEAAAPELRSHGVAAISVEVDNAEQLVVVAEPDRLGELDAEALSHVAARVREAVAREHGLHLYGLVLIRSASMPRTSSGKIRRYECREALRRGELTELARVFGLSARGASPAETARDVTQERPPVNGGRGAGPGVVPVGGGRDAAPAAPPANGGAKPAGWKQRTRADVERWLVTYLEQNLGVSPKSFTRTSNLAELGLDSAEVAQLVGDLAEWLGGPVTMTLLWEHPTIERAAEHLSGEDEAPRKIARAARPAPPAATTSHAFVEYINPHLGERLVQLRLDKQFVRGTGCDLYDAEGYHYLDFLAAYGALPFGHNPPEVWDALARTRESQRPSFIQPSMLGSAGELARRLIELAPPGLRHVTFANSGAEAVEAAVKLSRTATGRMGILSTSGSFHGKTLGALSATGNASYQEGFGAPAPDFHSVEFGDIDALRRAFTERPGYYAALILEPIQGEGGIVEPPPGYLAAAQEVCQGAGALFVLDEIQTGLGRTGALFAGTAEGVEPDVLLLAKALGGGLVPIGACISTSEAYTEDFALKHSSTFAGGALACEAGIAALDLLSRDDFALLRRVAENGERMKRALVELQRRFPRLVHEVRGRGYLLGVRFGVDRRTWGSSLLGLAAEQEGFTPLLASYLLNVEGVRVAPTLNGTDVVRIEPPLTATWEQCEAVIGALARTLELWDAGDASRVLGSILSRSPRPATALPERAPAEPVEPRPGDGRFAFVLHPLDLQSYVSFDPTLESMPPAELEEAVMLVHGLGEAAVVSEARIFSAAGPAAYGEFIVVGHTAEELMDMPADEAVAEVRAAVELARDRGARIVGLGAFTSVVTQGGLAVAGCGVPITTGNSFTAVSSVEAVRMALSKRGRTGPEPVAAVIGAAGAIGRVIAILMAEEACRLVLLGNPRRGREHNRARLLSVAAGACRHVASQASQGVVFRPGTVASRMVATGLLPPPGASDAAIAAAAERMEREYGLFMIAHEVADALALADVVMLATNATTSLIKPEELRRGALVCDVSRPRNVGEDVQRARPDVLIIDGGIIEVPGSPRLEAFDLAQGLSYACAAETMMLALEQRYQHMSLGASLDMEGLLLMRQLSKRHGFKVASLRSFDRPLPPERLLPREEAAPEAPGGP